MEDVYLVIGGCYSDWYIVGYFETEEEAEKYCICENKKDNNCEELYTEKVKMLKINGKINKIKLRKFQEITFVLENKNGIIDGKMRKNEDDYVVFEGEKRKSEICTFNIERYITFKVDNIDRGKAEKISQDYFYQYLNFYNEFGNLREAYNFMKKNIFKQI